MGFVKEGHLRWDSLGEFLAMAVAIEDLANKTNNLEGVVLAECLNNAIAKLLTEGKSPKRRVMELDNRGSHFYLALYWAEALAAQSKSEALKSQFSRVAAELLANETIIVNELIKCQGKAVDIGGYCHPDPAKVEKVMRPSVIFNAILTLGANW